MSTRCQVIIKDSYEEIWFYRHCDGYPKGVKPTISKFLKLVKEGCIRDNPLQASGWLVRFGAEEIEAPSQPEKTLNGWKASSYEPSPPKIMPDIDHLYVINLETKQAYEIGWDENNNPIDAQLCSEHGPFEF